MQKKTYAKSNMSHEGDGKGRKKPQFTGGLRGRKKRGALKDQPRAIAKKTCALQQFKIKTGSTGRGKEKRDRLNKGKKKNLEARSAGGPNF